MSAPSSTRLLDAEGPAGLLDEPDHALDGGHRVVPQAERERQVEQHLRVGRPDDVRVERRVDGEHEVPLDRRELPDRAVVGPQPAVVPERVAVGLLDGGPGGGSDVRDEDRRVDVAGELLQVRVGRGGLDASEQGRLGVAGAAGGWRPSVTGRIGARGAAVNARPARSARRLEAGRPGWRRTARPAHGRAGRLRGSGRAGGWPARRPSAARAGPATTGGRPVRSARGRPRSRPAVSPGRPRRERCRPPPRRGRGSGG